MNPFADLHCHSTCSDGTCSPEEILDLAVQKGLKGISITDHDSTSAYEGLFEKAAARNLEVITGVEFSCSHKNVSVHILGYNFDLDAAPLIELVSRHKKRREERNLAILEKLAFKSMPISPEEMTAQGSKTIGRPHIALAMVKKGYVANLQEAFKKYLAEGKPCYAPGKTVSVEETIAILQASGGKAVIAHPHLLNSPKTLQDLLKMPFNGIECYYANFPAERNKRWIDLAARKGWLETGGSDFHGSIKPTLYYGASFVDEARFRLLQQKS